MTEIEEIMQGAPARQRGAEAGDAPGDAVQRETPRRGFLKLKLFLLALSAAVAAASVSAAVHFSRRARADAERKGALAKSHDALFQAYHEVIALRGYLAEARALPPPEDRLTPLEVQDRVRDGSLTTEAGYSHFMASVFDEPETIERDLAAGVARVRSQLSVLAGYGVTREAAERQAMTDAERSASMVEVVDFVRRRDGLAPLGE